MTSTRRPFSASRRCTCGSASAPSRMSTRRLEVRERLEQRDRVDDRRASDPGERDLGQLVDGGEVLGGLRERHDVATGRRARRNRRCTAPIARKVSSTSTVRGSRVAVDAVLRDVRERAVVHLRVLPHLELGEVEPERLHLPDQPLQVAVGRPRARRPRPASAARRRGRPRAPRRAPYAEVGVARPGRGDPLGEEVDDPTVRLVGRVDRRSARPAPRTGRAGAAQSASSSADAGVPSASRVSPRAVRRADASSSEQRVLGRRCRAACRVISAVTFGLPSRSPPIHDPSRTNARHGRRGGARRRRPGASRRGGGTRPAGRRRASPRRR